MVVLFEKKKALREKVLNKKWLAGVKLSNLVL